MMHWPGSAYEWGKAHDYLEDSEHLNITLKENLLQNSHDVIPAKAGIHRINHLQIKTHGFRLKTCRNDGVLQVSQEYQ